LFLLVLSKLGIAARSARGASGDQPGRNPRAVPRSSGVRRLPIVGDDGQLVGIVSIDDLLEVLAEQMTDLTKIVSREQAHEAQARR